MESIELEEISSANLHRREIRFADFVADNDGIIRPVEFQDHAGLGQPAPSTSTQQGCQGAGSTAGTERPQNVEQEIVPPVQVAEDNNGPFNGAVNSIPETSFAMPIDPAPTGSECVMYVARNIYCFGRECLSSFYGELRGESELLLLNFNLALRSGSDYFDLRITDVTRPFESHLSLARFQQAELHLQFLNTNRNGTVVVHEEPAFKVSLDLPHSKWKSKAEWGTFLHQRQRQRAFSVLCANVLPADKIQEAVQQQPDNQFMIIIRIYFKLIQGELDVLHGIQKCFHPDKSLYNLRDTMANSLINAEDSDMMLVSGDNVGYRAHRAILAANSDVFKAMFLSGLEEAKSGMLRTPPFVSGKVLEAFLKYLYARNRKDLEEDPTLTMSVLRFAHIYGMDLLVDVCEETILAMPMELFSLESSLHIFQCAELLDRAGIESKIVHILMRMDVKLSSSQEYIKFLHTAPNAAAKMTEMIVKFQNAGPSKK